uniref:PH domain-containing protein n=2 Tax=Anopheles melas TaxID=34690 RepID=A0A182UFV1_9DIPT
MRLAPSPRNVEETEAESDQSTGRSQFRAKRGNVLSYHCRWLLVGSVSVGLGWRFLRPHGFAAEYVNNATRKVHSKKAVVGRDWVYASTGDIRSRCSRICSIYEQQCAQKIKLVDVEKVEWLNRRSYSAIGLLLGSREGRVLLRSDQGLEDWFELLEECTLSSKERRRALRLTQGPRSRASLAAPVSAASLQSNHLGLGGTYSGAIEDWLMSRHQKTGAQRFNHILLSDSVPDLSSINENGLCSGLLTNHSTPKKVPNARHNLSGGGGGGGGGGSSNGYSSHNGSLYNGFPYSPLKKLADNFVNGNHSYTLHDDLEEEVELRRGGRYRDNDDLYRRPLGPGGNDSSRHSFLTDLDYAGCDSGLDTPPSTHRPSSCRDNIYFASAYNNHHAHGSGFLGKDKTTDTGISSSRGTLVSPASSIRHGYVNVQHFNGNGGSNNTTTNNNNNNHLNSYGSR